MNFTACQKPGPALSFISLTWLVRECLLGLALLGICLPAPLAFAAPERDFRAGSASVDITPRQFPVIVNAMFTERSANRAADPLHARSLLLDDGQTRLAITVVDSCMLPRDLIDEAK